MAFSPFQMPGPGTVSESARGLAESLGSLADFRRQQDMDRAAKLKAMFDQGARNRELDIQGRQVGLQEEAQRRLQMAANADLAVKLKTIKDPSLRRALIQLHGGQILDEQDATGGAAPGAPAMPQQQPQPPQGGSAAGPLAQPAATGQPGQSLASTIAQAAGPNPDHVRWLSAAQPYLGTGQAQSDDPEAEALAGGDQQPAPSLAQPPANPLQKLAAAKTSEDQRRAGMLLAAQGGGRGPAIGKRIRFKLGDQEMVLDPAEEKAIEDAQRAENAQTMGGSGIDPKYLRFTQTLLSMGVGPSDVGKMAAGMMQHDSDAAAKLDAENRRNSEWDRRFNKAEPGRNRRAAVMGANPRLASAAAEISNMVENGDENGQPYTTGDIQKRAAELGIPLSGKAGTTSVESILRETTARTRGSDTHKLRGGALQVTGADGTVLGTAKSAQDAQRLTKSEAQFDQLKNRMQDLIDDVKANGDRVVSPKAVRRRESRYANVAAAARVYNGLSATDASMQLEKEGVGPAGTPGHGFVMGADVDVLQHVLDEAERQHKARINVGLRAPTASPGATRPSGRPGQRRQSIDEMFNHVMGRK